MQFAEDGFDDVVGHVGRRRVEDNHDSFIIYADNGVGAGIDQMG